jgi:imidazole glycerol phosphate synthase glutamine amidotransferase subunit
VSKQKAFIVPTRVANIASMKAALRRADITPVMADSADQLYQAEFTILPGVGSFQPGMQELVASGADQALKARIAEGKKTLAVCLGMQLLCSTSEEGTGINGLGVFDCSVTRFPDRLRVPQFGWNRIEADADCKLLQSGYAYFANSYRLATAPKTVNAARSDYGGEFVAAIEHNGLLACQFHPELSGRWGQALIERWINQ